MTTVLFLCPHNAAKSVVAAALLQRASDEGDLGLTIQTAGTDPDETVKPTIRARLEADGMTTNEVPRRVRSEQLDGADLAINMGCDHHDLPTPRQTIDWQIPDFSINFETAYSAISDHVAALARELEDRS